MIIGIGNVLNGDDGAGNYVAQLVNRRLAAEKDRGEEPEILAIDAGTAPESFTSVIRRQRPELLVLVDAADMGLPPGAVRLVGAERLRTPSFSTHSMPLTALAEYVRELAGRVDIIGVQPSMMTQGQRLSSVVKEAAAKLAGVLLAGYSDEIESLE